MTDQHDDERGANDDRLDPVATTARLTAAERARESARPDRLFDDPLADTLAGEPGRALMRRLSDTLPFDNPTIAVRTRYFDDQLTGIDEPAPRQIVLIAAGMDTRAFRLGPHRDTTLFEVDRPDLLRLKESLLADAPTPRCTRRAVGADLAGDWPSALARAGFDPDQPTCWLTEGLLQYLTEGDVQRLLDRITEASADGSHLLIDFVGRSLLDHPMTRTMLDALAERGMTWHYGTDNPEEPLTARGWKPEVTRIGGFAGDLGRWPFPDAPRGTPGVPQGYLVHATR